MSLTCVRGNSWLGVAAINAASRDPHPSLKCIAPWEGHSVSSRPVVPDVDGKRTIIETSWCEVASRQCLSVIGCKESSSVAIRWKIQRNKSPLTPCSTIIGRPREFPWVRSICQSIRLLHTRELSQKGSSRLRPSSFIHTHGSIRTFREAKSKNKWSVHPAS